jgi:hypothetical protein
MLCGIVSFSLKWLGVTKFGWVTPFGPTLSHVTTTTWLRLRADFVDLSLLVGSRDQDSLFKVAQDKQQL